MGITKYALENAKKLGIVPERLEVLDKLLQEYIDNGQRQAIVFKATKDDVTIFEGTYGTNTKPGGVRMDTIFSLMSITKPVVAALILCLQEDGIVDITEPVCKYLPEFTGDGKEDICLWHFMTHSSGINEEDLYERISKYVEENYGVKIYEDGLSDEESENRKKEVLSKLGVKEDDNARMKNLEYLISLNLKPKYKPGVDMSYLSYGFQILADVISEVTGKTIDEYAKEKIFGPLGMKDTVWKLPKDKYSRVIGRVDTAVSADYFNSENNYLAQGGGGGLMSTVEDMTIFMQMILGGGTYKGIRIMSPASIELMRNNHNQGVLSNGSEEYASWSMGWNVKGNKKDGDGILRSPNSIDHTGFAGTKILMDPDRNLTMASFSVENIFFMEPEFININGRVVNVLISALENN